MRTGCARRGIADAHEAFEGDVRCYCRVVATTGFVRGEPAEG
jgi:hypothetical protein